MVANSYSMAENRLKKTDNELPIVTITYYRTSIINYICIFHSIIDYA